MVIDSISMKEVKKDGSLGCELMVGDNGDDWNCNDKNAYHNDLDLFLHDNACKMDKG